MTHRNATLLCLAVSALFAASAVSAAPQYREVDVTAAVSPSFLPMAINDEGVVALFGFVDGQRVSKLYDSENGEVVRILPGDQVTAISNSGDMVGIGATGAWFESGGVRTSIPLQRPLSLNDKGQVAGFAGGFFPRGAVYSVPDGTLTPLSLGGNQSAATGINASGRVAGSGTLPGSQTIHAFAWDGSTIRDLGTLGGDGNSFAAAINRRGHIAGSASISSTQAHAFVFDGETMHDLGTLQGCDRSNAAAINNAGTAVGSVDLCADGSSHAVLFSKKGGVVDLNTVAPASDGFTYSNAIDINNAGTIVGIAVGPDGFTTRAFLLVRE
jgi:probable HAF family extracellular repeat protein